MSQASDKTADKANQLLQTMVSDTAIHWQTNLLRKATGSNEFDATSKDFEPKVPDYQNLFERIHKSYVKHVQEQYFLQYSVPTSAVVQYKLQSKTVSSSIKQFFRDVEFHPTDELMQIVYLLANEAKITDGKVDTFNLYKQLSKELASNYLRICPHHLFGDYRAKLVASMQTTQAETNGQHPYQAPREVEQAEGEAEQEAEEEEEKKHERVRKVIVEEQVFEDDYYFKCLSLPALVFDVPLSVQVIIFTLLTKCRFWPQLSKMKISKHGKGTGVEFLKIWFKTFRRRFESFIVSDMDLSLQSVKQIKSLKQKMIKKPDRSEEELLCKVDSGDVEAVRAFLLKGGDVNTRFIKEKQQGLLHRAAANGNLAMINMLKTFNPDLDLGDEAGMSPLFYAVSGKSPEAVKLLIDIGANPNHQDNHSSTPIYWATYSSTLEVMKALKEGGSKLHVSNMISRTPLLKAAYTGRFDVVEWLLQFQETIDNINARDERGRTALHTACWGSSGGRQGKHIRGESLTDSLDSMRLLLKKGADVSIQ